MPHRTNIYIIMVRFYTTQCISYLCTASAEKKSNTNFKHENMNESSNKNDILCDMIKLDKLHSLDMFNNHKKNEK